jgi:hypothetical protein
MTPSSWIALATLAVALLGMGAKLVRAMSQIEIELKRIRAERKILLRVPFLEFQLSLIAKHLGIELPPIPQQPSSEDSSNAE